MKNSYFDGGLFQIIGWRLLGFLVTICTLGICYPWAVCMRYRWEVKHTVIDGHRLSFNGTAMQLFGSWIKWWFFTLITLGIYGLWVPIKLKDWITRHSEFSDAPASGPVQRDIQEALTGSISCSSKPTADAFSALLFVGVVFCVLGIVAIFYSWYGYLAVAIGLAILFAADQVA